MSDQVDVSVVDLSKFEKKRFHDSLGREIAVFDGLLNSKDLDALRLFLLQYNSAFMYQGFDTSGDEEHDNVSWIAMLKVHLSHVLFIFLLNYVLLFHLFVEIFYYSTSLSHIMHNLISRF